MAGHAEKDWRRSEGRLRVHGKGEQRKDRKLHAYRPSEQENSREKRPNEMMRMESSYGGIVMGASRSRKMKMVVHETRRHNGPTLEKDQKEVEGGRMASLSELRGDFHTNSHSRSRSAFVYEETLEETPLKMLERIQEMMDENCQESAERILPFLDKKEDEQLRQEIQGRLRLSQEQEHMEEYSCWNRIREDYNREQSEKEQMRKQFFRELSFAREKSRRLMRTEEAALSAFDGSVFGISGAEEGEFPAGDSPDEENKKVTEKKQEK